MLKEPVIIIIIYVVTGYADRLTKWNLFLIGIVNLFCILTGGWIIIQFVAFRKEEPSMCAVSNSLFQSTVIQDPNTKRFKITLIYYDTDPQYVNFWGNPLHRATERHINFLCLDLVSER